MPDMSTIMNMMNSMSSNHNKAQNSGNILDDIAKFQDSNTNSQQFTNPSNDSEEKSENQNHINANGMPDMETMMRIMKVMNSMNSPQNNASANLLNSLRPFLRDSKKEKLDQYVKMVKISNVISELNHLGGEEK